MNMNILIESEALKYSVTFIMKLLCHPFEVPGVEITVSSVYYSVIESNQHNAKATILSVAPSVRNVTNIPTTRTPGVQ